MSKKKKDLISFIILAILFVVIFICNDFGIPCIIHKLTGLHCPGCGGTRAFLALLRLDFYQAFRYNMLVVIAIPFFIVHLVCRYIFKLQYKIPNWILCILIVIVILYGVLRNIPYFSFLAPTTI